jgi:hypothetical protein
LFALPGFDVAAVQHITQSPAQRLNTAGGAHVCPHGVAVDAATQMQLLSVRAAYFHDVNERGSDVHDCHSDQAAR